MGDSATMPTGSKSLIASQRGVGRVAEMHDQQVVPVGRLAGNLMFQRIGERHRFEAELVEEGRQRVEIDEPAQRHGRGGNQPAARDFLVSVADLVAHPGQAAIVFMLLRGRGIDRDYEAGNAGASVLADPLCFEQSAIAHQHDLDALAGSHDE